MEHEKRESPPGTSPIFESDYDKSKKGRHLKSWQMGALDVLNIIPEYLRISKLIEGTSSEIKLQPRNQLVNSKYSKWGRPLITQESGGSI